MFMNMSNIQLRLSEGEHSVGRALKDSSSRTIHVVHGLPTFTPGAHRVVVYDDYGNRGEGYVGLMKRRRESNTRIL